MFVDEHVQVATHQDDECDDAGAGHQTQTGRDIHDLPHNARNAGSSASCTAK